MQWNVSYFYAAILLVLTLLSGVLPLVCIVMAWTSMWGRILPRKNSDVDPWRVKGIVDSFLTMTQVKALSGANKEVPEQTDKLIAMDPEDAIRLVIRTRQIASTSFLALAAVIVLCATILSGMFLNHAVSERSLQISGAQRSKQDHENNKLVTEEAKPQPQTAAPNSVKEEQPQSQPTQ